MDGEEEERDNNNGKSFGEHWGWFGSLYNLSKSNILSITGDKAITDLNLLFCLTFLEIQKDYDEEIEKSRKRALQQQRLRY